MLFLYMRMCTVFAQRGVRDVTVWNMNQIGIRAYIDIVVCKYYKICLGKITFWPWLLKTSVGSFEKIAKLKILRAPVFGSKTLEIENISLRSIFDHLLCYLHFIDSVLANKFDEI